MINSIKIEDVCDAICLHWKVAHESDKHDSWLYRWKLVEEKLMGMWKLVLHAKIPDVQKDERNAILDETSTTIKRAKLMWLIGKADDAHIEAITHAIEHKDELSAGFWLRDAWNRLT